MRVWKGNLDEYKGSDGAGSERGGTCGPLAMFGITSDLCPDVQPGWVASQKGNECPHLSRRKRFYSVGIEGDEITYCLKKGCVWSKHGE